MIYLTIEKLNEYKNINRIASRIRLISMNVIARRCFSKFFCLGTKINARLFLIAHENEEYNVA